ncbi:MAG: Na+/H+ antiporter subunit G [Rhodocyclaceae bacterium]|jgi:multicomponent K+:H+ antiporter subunit G|nr:Na+/H+ antiporter subunit G [Rhodocyclaceae bacterium]MCL4758896.1 Na+/H+ antiporter subunit G [Rhodocyclaceae bacterium]
MPFVLELAVSLLIVIGAVFMLVGSLGMVKLPDLMSRLHAPTKATTLGVGGALIASMLYFLGTDGALSIHEVLITFFLFLTAPVTAHLVAKAHLHAQGGAGLPPTGGGCGWSTFESTPETAASESPSSHNKG